MRSVVYFRSFYTFYFKNESSNFFRICAFSESDQHFSKMRSKFCYFILKYIYSCIYNKKILKNDHFDNILGCSSDLICHLRPCLLGFQINFTSLMWFEAFPLPTCQVYSKDSLFRNFEKWILTVDLTGRKVAKINNKLRPFKMGSTDLYMYRDLKKHYYKKK